MFSIDRKKVLQIPAFMACGRCGRYFETLVRNIALFFRGLLTDRSPFKAASNAFVAEERALEDLGGLTGSPNLQSGLYAHFGQADRASGSRPGMNSCYPASERPEGVPPIGPSASSGRYAIYSEFEFWALGVRSGRIRRSTGPYVRFYVWTSENTPSTHSGA